MMRLMRGDCLEKMKKIESESVDLVVTSPPYDQLRTYGNSLEWNFEIFQKVANGLNRALKKGGVIVWVVADATIKGSETGSSFRQALYFKEIGLRIHDTMIWNKRSSPFQHKNRYINCFEYMFILSKGAPKTHNLIRDRKNKWAGTRVHGTETQKNGKRKPLSKKQMSKNVKEYGARLNIWEITPFRHRGIPHPAMFPIQLASDHISTWSNPGDVVLDPFVGSGTTGVAAKELGRDFIGIEKYKEYCYLAKRRIQSLGKK